MNDEYRCTSCGAKLGAFHSYFARCVFAKDESTLVKLEHCLALQNNRPLSEDFVAETWTEEGNKDDSDKLRYDLIPPETLEALAWILTFGAQKYGDRNWEKGMKWGRPFAALMRHMWAWWRGQNLDPETGKSHLWHALACLTFLVTFEQKGIGTDDRSDGKP